MRGSKKLDDKKWKSAAPVKPLDNLGSKPLIHNAFIPSYEKGHKKIMIITDEGEELDWTRLQIFEYDLYVVKHADWLNQQVQNKKHLSKHPPQNDEQLQGCSPLQRLQGCLVPAGLLGLGFGLHTSNHRGQWNILPNECRPGLQI
ncbi:hypothetical protein J437_LFUL011380 [Ladona fulva]|uniref:Uncharacterized protein n=1 Tax=Ladona fulva TaxID=123851 RepID=A0A8K0KD55_LADFU|nr:hypothetical protein J437_LFUL011380 [Ladona fulva]